ncbi:TetR/AcrR family transcriptional regulator [Mucilaginibacter sp. P19]|uniref:TetR/AcrR family transcriptional regulator n=1 Tax=Mucilaginibacter sp. P19 TaxID=3423947 RepID=UPI003D679848
MNHTKIESRNLLFLVSEKLFADHEFYRTTIRMIAGNSGLYLALISYYFGVKRDMFIQIFRDRLGRLNSVLERIPYVELPAPEKLMVFLEEYSNVFRNNINFHRLLHREITFLPESAVKDHITDYLDNTLAILKKLIEDGIEEGHFKATDSQLVYLTIFVMLPVMISGSPVSRHISENIAPCGNVFSTELIKKYLYYILKAQKSENSYIEHKH